MPQLSRWMIRAAFVYLLLGFTLGGLLLAHKGLPYASWLWSWRPAHIEFLLTGWIVQLTMGMAFWILPRYWQEPRRPKERYAVVAFWFLNLGIWLVVAGTSFRLGYELLLAGRSAQIAAVIFFALHAWKRIVSREGA